MKLDTLRITHLIALVRNPRLPVSKQQDIWTEVYGLLRPWVLSRLTSITNDPADREGAFGEALAITSAKLPCLRWDCRFPSCVLRTAKRLLGKQRAELARDALGHRAVTASPGGEAEECWSEHIPGPLSVEQLAQDREMLRAVASRLPANQLRILMLRAEGHSEQEVAARLELTVGTVKMRSHYARKALRQWCGRDR